MGFEIIEKCPLSIVPAVRNVCVCVSDDGNDNKQTHKLAANNLVRRIDALPTGVHRAIRFGVHHIHM